MKKTKINKKVTIESIDEKINQLIDNTDKFQSLVVKKFAKVDEQFAKVDEQFKLVRLEISEVKTEIALINRKLNELEKRLDQQDEKLRGQGYFAKEIDELRVQINKLQTALEKNGINVN